MGVDRPVAEFRLKFVAKEADSRSAIENQDLVGISPDFNA
jgi:hypothetical protein